MRFNKKIMANLSHKYAMFALGAASILTACSKDNTPAAADVEVKFGLNYANSMDQIHPDSLRDLAARPDVANIYLVMDGTFEGVGPKGMAAMVQQRFKPAINAVPGRIFGRDNFYCEPNVFTTTDSLWMTDHGWTIRHVKQKQR